MEIQTVFQVSPEKRNVDTLSDKEQKQLDAMRSQCELLCLKGNSYSKQFFVVFLEQLKRMNQLKVMKFYFDYIISEQMLMIFLQGVVGRFQNHYLYIKKNKIIYKLLGSGLIGKQIYMIDLSNNAINLFGAEALKPFLRQAQNLQIFQIDNCGLGIEGVTHIAQGLGEGASNLEVFAIARNRAENEGASQIALNLNQLKVEFLLFYQFLKKLKQLHIYQNGIKQIGMICLLQSLVTNCPNLELLDIKDNFIHEETTNSLCQFITKQKNLKCLNISDNNIKCSQNDHILDAMESSEIKFKKLGYNYSELNDVQGERLLQILKRQFQYIQNLELLGNIMSRETKIKFLELFKGKNVLRAFESNEEQDSDELVIKFSNLEVGN